MKCRVALSTLAIALLTIGMGATSTWAGSDPPSALKFTHSTKSLNYSPRMQVAQNCRLEMGICGGPHSTAPCCPGFVCTIEGPGPWWYCRR
jgi:hypothetical protein